MESERCPNLSGAETKDATYHFIADQASTYPKIFLSLLNSNKNMNNYPN